MVFYRLSDFEVFGDSLVVVLFEKERVFFEYVFLIIILCIDLVGIIHIFVFEIVDREFESVYFVGGNFNREIEVVFEVEFGEGFRLDGDGQDDGFFDFRVGPGVTRAK